MNIDVALEPIEQRVEKYCGPANAMY